MSTATRHPSVALRVDCLDDLVEAREAIRLESIQIVDDVAWRILPLGVRQDLGSRCRKGHTFDEVSDAGKIHSPTLRIQGAYPHDSLAR